MSDLMISRRLQCRRRGGGRLKPLGKFRGTGIRQSTSQSTGGFANGYNAGRMDAEQKKGRWEQDKLGTFLCSNCHSGFKEQPTCMGRPMFEYCPICGAKMEVVE